MNKSEITALFDQWNSALKLVTQTGCCTLAGDAILLPTVSNKVRHNHAEIEDYFVHFWLRDLRV